MAVKRPEARIVGIECDNHTAAWRHQHGVAYRAGKALSINLDDLELVPVQMHRMWHSGLVDHHQLHPFAFGDWQRRDLGGPGDIVD